MLFQICSDASRYRIVGISRKFKSEQKKCPAPKCCIFGAPRVFGDLGRMFFLFSGSWGALVIILGELGSKLIILGI